MLVRNSLRGWKMSVRKVVAIVLVGLLVAPPMASISMAAPQSPSNAGMEVDVDPSQACVLAGEYPQFQGVVVPMDGITRSRLFFRSSLSPDMYYVEAVLESGRYVARIPRPTRNAGPIMFYLEATKNDFSQGRSGEGNAIVVRKIEECPADRKAAPIAPGGPVSVFDVAGNPAFPAGFEGITGAGAAGAAGAAGGVGGAAGAGAGFLTSTAGLITLGAIAVGVTTIVLVTNDSNPRPPASPSR
jgi:hypothetical protein